MLSIRFTRIGRKKAPLYRIVIMDKRRDPWGKYIEKLGFYNPKTKETQLNKERISYWLLQGAQCSPSVFNLFLKNELVKGDKQKSVKITKKRGEKINKDKEDKKARDEKASEDKKVDTEKAVEEVKTEDVLVKEIKVEESPTTEILADKEVPVVEETIVDKKEESPVVEEKPVEETPVIEESPTLVEEVKVEESPVEETPAVEKVE